MRARRTPWAVVLASVLSVLVAAGALVGAVVVREQRVAPAQEPPPTVTPPPTTGVCLVEPCRVLAVAKIAGTTVELIADSGATSGRLRIGGPSSSSIIETTVTDLGVTLTKSSLQCVVKAMSACLVSGSYDNGLAGQAVVGRSGKWSSLARPFVSGAGYLALADVASSQSGPEVLAAQYDCAAGTPADCAGEPVFVQVFAIVSGTEVGCTRTYDDVGSLPGHPRVSVRAGDLSPC